MQMFNGRIFMTYFLGTAEYAHVSCGRADTCSSQSPWKQAVRGKLRMTTYQE